MRDKRPYEDFKEPDAGLNNCNLLIALKCPSLLLSRAVMQCLCWLIQHLQS